MEYNFEEAAFESKAQAEAALINWQAREVLEQDIIKYAQIFYGPFFPNGSRFNVIIYPNIHGKPEAWLIVHHKPDDSTAWKVLKGDESYRGDGDGYHNELDLLFNLLFALDSGNCANMPKFLEEEKESSELLNRGN